MVPAMQVRRVDEAAEESAAKIDVRVRENSAEQIQRRIPLGNFRGHPEQDRDWRADYDRFDDVDRVETARIDDAQARRAVVYGVESPEQRHFVRPAVRQVIAQIPQNDAWDDLYIEWPVSGPHLQRYERLDPRDCPGDRPQADDGCEGIEGDGEDRQHDIVAQLAVVAVPRRLQSQQALHDDQYREKQPVHQLHGHVGVPPDAQP